MILFLVDNESFVFADVDDRFGSDCFINCGTKRVYLLSSCFVSEEGSDLGARLEVGEEGVCAKSGEGKDANDEESDRSHDDGRD